MELTKSELEVMDVLWENGGALSRSDFLEHTDEKTWKDSSVHILLNGLLKKGVIREAGFVKRSKTYGRTFLPTLTREEYYALNVYSHRRKPEITGLVEALLRQESITPEELDTIARLVKERQSK